MKLEQIYHNITKLFSKYYLILLYYYSY